MTEMKDETGNRYGRFTVVRLAQRRNGRLWLCRCDCGSMRIKRIVEFRHGTVSCGCLKNEKFRKMATTHGESKTREYASWQACKARCHNPSNAAYRHYGARGIHVCERWRESFENFLLDMGRRPPEHSLGRIDNNGNYEPGNCRWATPSEQMSNRTTVRKIEWNGKIWTLTTLAKHVGVSRHTMAYRLNAGWPMIQCVAPLWAFPSKKQREAHGC
jgi:hypothetical protein